MQRLTSLERHIDDWCNSLAKIGVLGIYDEESRRKNWMRSQAVRNTKKLGSSSDGKYKYYLSTNKDADEVI